MVEAPTASEQPIAIAPQANAAGSARRLEDLLDSAAKTGKSSLFVWVGFLCTGIYLAAATHRVSHYDFLLSRNLRLPWVNLSLPLVIFAWLMPACFLVLHFFVLRRFAKITRCGRDFDTELCAAIPEKAERDWMRGKLPNNLLIKIVAGPSRIRDGIIGLFLWLFIALALSIGPILLLASFQLQFLPYHDLAITWWQRAIVLADLLLLWRYWPRIGLPAVETSSSGWPSHRGLVEGTQQLGTVAGMFLLTVVVCPLVLLVATIPGEWLERDLRGVPRVASLRKLIVAGELDQTTHQPASWWSDRLVLPQLDLAAVATSQTAGGAPAGGQILSLRERHLEGAVLIGARLGPVDLGAAHLEGAMLDEADLRGALLDDTRLQGASLDGARLEGVRLVRTQLQGASLKDAHIEGAMLDAANLAGAVLKRAHLQGALLRDVQLQGADLDDAKLQAAVLERPQLHAASLVQTHLEGALLDGAQLQGASFDRVHLSGTWLRNPFVWRSYIRLAEPAALRVEDLQPAAKQRDATHGISDWSATASADLKARVAREGPQNTATATALWRLARLDRPSSPEEERQAAEQWAKLQTPPPAVPAYETALAGVWQKIGCSSDGAPHIMANMVEALTSPSSLLSQDAARASALAAALLEAGCAGANGLSDAVKDRLKAVRDRGLPTSAAADPQVPARPAARSR